MTDGLPRDFPAAFLEGFPFPVLCIAADHRVLWRNGAAARRGAPQHEPCYRQLFGYDEPCDTLGDGCPMREVARSGRPARMLLNHARGDHVDAFEVVAMPCGDVVLEMHVPVDPALSQDRLTGLINRDTTETVAKRTFALLSRLSHPVGVAMLDIDHFKRINDTFGHAAGDAVLAAIGRTLRAQFRSSDVVGRWGGEEFVVILPASTAEQAAAKIEAVLEVVRDLRVAYGPDTLQVTFSAGAWCGPSSVGFTQALSSADRALYEAKARGRDRLVMLTGTLA